MTQDFQKEFCLMLNRMWNLGVADPEMFMQTDEQLQAKIGSGRITGTYDQRSMIQVGLDALEANDPSRMLVAFPVTFEGVERERYRGPRSFAGGSGLAITVSCEDPDRAFQFLDDLASEECQTVLRWGIEGTDWSYGEDGSLVKTEEQWAQYNDINYKQTSGIEQMGWFNFWPGLEPFPTAAPSPLPPTRRNTRSRPTRTTSWSSSPTMTRRPSATGSIRPMTRSTNPAGPSVSASTPATRERSPARPRSPSPWSTSRS